MKPGRPIQLDIGKALGIMGLVAALIAPFLPWVVTETASITLVQTGWWMALLPAIFVGSSGLMNYFSRRLKTVVLFLSGMLVVVANVVVFTVLLPLEANTFALGFYASLGSASLLLEGGIITYVEEIKGTLRVNAKLTTPSGLCPWCADDLHFVPPSPRICPICEKSLVSDERAIEPERKEVVVVVSGI
jgi:hypothetical protein